MVVSSCENEEDEVFDEPAVRNVEQMLAAHHSAVSPHRGMMGGTVTDKRMGFWMYVMYRRKSCWCATHAFVFMRI